jgi:glycosyltransferase involved in cell wall biosynthesis
MSQVHVLVFIDWYRPGYKAGGPTQSCANLVDHLAGKDIYFSIITRNTDYYETTPYLAIKSNTWIKFSENHQVYYISDECLNKNTLFELMKSIDADVLYINGIYSRWFSITPLQLARKIQRNWRIVIASRGMFAPSAIAIKSWKKKLYLKWAKWTSFYKHVTFHATSEHEVSHIRNAVGESAKVISAGNLPERKERTYISKHKKEGELHLICIARIAPEKNIAYALNILEHVHSQIKLDIYGPVYDEEYAEQCYAQALTLPANIAVHFHGPVIPESIDDLLAKANVLFLPSRGENFGHVILQSLLSSCPVIVSDQTPWRDLEKKQAGYDLSLDYPQQFIDAIHFYSKMSENEFNAYSLAAFQLGSKYADTGKLVQENKMLFTAL